MILILSEDTDQSTNRVIDWLYFNNKDFIRINTESFIHHISLCLNDEQHLSIEVQSENNEDTFSLQNIDSFWFRRGTMMPRKQLLNEIENTNLKKEISNTLTSEWTILSSFLIKQFEKKKHLGNYGLRIPNKLTVLQMAVKHGIDIPDTMVTSSLEKLKEFKNKHASIITKPIYEILMYADQQYAFISRTETVGEDYIENLPDSFFPMLFQENLRKNFEIRVFFIKDKFFPAAFFSQNNAKTKSDFRNESNVKYRSIPYNLPPKILKKLKTMMHDLGLNTGSIDLVYTQEKKYVFLEVNPVGQFDTVSEDCNYFIEKEIVKFLLN